MLKRKVLSRIGLILFLVGGLIIVGIISTNIVTDDGTAFIVGGIGLAFAIAGFLFHLFSHIMEG